VLPFQDAALTPGGDWRHIVRFGRNVASYKFSLGQALLELAARQQTFVPLPELAVPYAAALCEHLQVEDRQSTSAQSQFLDACRSRNRGDLEAEQLAEATVRLGFANVIDAFHVSRGGQPTQTRFFVDERASRQGITLTGHDGAFDAGLLTVDASLQVHVSSALAGAVRADPLARQYYGRPPLRDTILLPDQAQLPGRKYLDWHRTNIFIS
jgi:hypothetical protein